MSNQRYDVAEKYLKEVASRAPFSDEAGSMIPGYYTNYAEALWHLGKYEESLDYARRAAKLTNDHSVDEEAKKRTQEYLRSLENDWKKKGKK